PRPVRALSYSGLARYAACSYRFYLERVLGLPEQEPPPGIVAEPAGLEARVRGTLAHELLEHLDLAPGAPLPGRQEVVEVAAGHGLDLADAEIADLIALVESFAASGVHARLRAASWVRREHAFAFPLLPGDPTGPLLNGVVDVLADEPGGEVLVVDWKTDRLGEREPAELVASAYAVQQAVYAVAVLASGAPAVEVAYAFLEAPEVVVGARFTPADLPALWKRVLARAAPVLDGRFPVSAEPHVGLCAGCPGRGGLCVHPLELTDRVREGV
ncbi:MAG: PD-(D/E)XK nuclease family protein, partial [Actinobacteria bacterium]|nr:PD-(D/E)XK nuclease family protein [Actinomycetota bacterium]